MSSLALSRVLSAPAGCAALLLLAPAAGAGTLNIVRYTAFDQHQPGVEDWGEYGGGSCDSCKLLESGIDVAANEYLATYNYASPFFPSYSTYSAFTALSGGRVGFGFIQGSVGGALRTTEVKDDRFFATFRGSWSDSLTVNSTELAGQPGVMTGSVRFDYTATTSVTASPTQLAENWGVEVVWLLSGEGVNAVAFRQEELDDEGPASRLFDPLLNGFISPAPPSVLVPVTYHFTYGVPFDISMELYAEASGGGFGIADDETQEWQAVANLNFLNTLAWQGISSVTDADGNPVSFSLQSESNNDWTGPATIVPLPAAGWLLLGSLASLAWRRRATAGTRAP